MYLQNEKIMGMAIILILLFIGVPTVILILFNSRISALENELKSIKNDLLFFRQQFMRSDEYSEIKQSYHQPVPEVIIEPVEETKPTVEEVIQPELIIPIELEPEILEDVKPEPIITEAKPQTAYKNDAPKELNINWFSNKEFESLIGGKLLNRIGALALIIGIGFFLKYAFDKNWISEWVRVSIGFISGFALIAGGWHFNKKEFKIFSQGLIGAGIAVLFLSVYASFNFYHLVPQIVAFIMMSAITAFTFWLGVRYNSIAVAILGWLGGFLTPFMLSTGQANEVGLFTYVAIFDIGIMFIFLRKQEWDLIPTLLLASTYFTYFTWFVVYYVPHDAIVTSIFLTIFWLIFALIEFYSIYSLNYKNTEAIKFTNILSLALYYFNLVYVLDKSHHVWMGLVTFLLAIAYFGLFKISLSKKSDDLFRLNNLLITTCALVLIATFFQFKENVTVSVLSAEAVIILFIGLRTKLKILNKFTMITFGLAVVKMILVNSEKYSELGHYWTMYNPLVLGALSISVSAFLCAFILKKNENNHFLKIAEIYSYLWSITLVYLIFNEITNYHTHLNILTNWKLSLSIESNQRLTYGYSLLIYATMIIYFGLRTKTLSTVYVALVSSGIGVLVILLGSLFQDNYQQVQIILNYRFISLLISIISLIFIYIFTRRYLSQIERFSLVKEVIFTTIVLIIIVPILTEISVYHEYLKILTKNFNLDSIYYNRSLTDAFSLAIYSVPLIYYGFKTKTNPAIYVALGSIGIGILMFTFGGLNYIPIQSFVPVLNYRALAGFIIILSLGTMILIMRKNKDNIDWLEKVNGLAFIVFIISIVFLISTETNDYFNRILHNWHSVRTDDVNVKVIMAEVTKYQNIQQLSLSGIWIFYSIFMLIIGIWKRMKLLRLLSIAFFGITIIKVFIFDLSFLETLYRIFSFIALGLILLTVSYLYQRYKNIILD